MKVKNSAWENNLGDLILNNLTIKSRLIYLL